MSTFSVISPQKWEGNVFERIGKQWMLVCAPDKGGANLMTASWGGLGVLWNKPVVFTFIRPQRYTRGLLDQADCYSLLFFEEKYRGQLTLCGTKSGREINKVSACGFTLNKDDGIPYVEEAEAVVFCKKLYAQDMIPRCFLDPAIPAKDYTDGDFHRTYISEITKIIAK